MIESSTKVTTAAWVGTTDGTESVLGDHSYRGRALNNLRYPIALDVQAVADQHYPGGPFPQPDPNLTKRTLTDLPNVIGKTVDDATRTLQNAGFTVTVGNPVDAPDTAGIIVQQDPPAGKVPGGTNVTITRATGRAGRSRVT